MHFGHTLQKIRKNRSLTQKHICEGIMKQGTYSRIENGQLDINAEQLALIVERLNISVNEFLYIHQNYSSTERQQLIHAYMNIELTLPSELKMKRANVKKYLSKHDDPDMEMLLYSYDAMIALTEQHGMEQVRAYSDKIWARLQMLDHWYINDLELLNAIIIYFPLDTAKEVVKTAISRIDAYDQYEKDLTYLKLYFKVNLTNLYLEEKRFEECLSLLNSVHQQFNKHFTYQTLGMIIERKIICKYLLQQPYEEDLQKLQMLEELFEDQEVFDLLYMELHKNVPELIDVTKRYRK